MVQSFILSFTALFVALDVIGGIPMYLSMVQRVPYLERKKVVHTSIFVAFIVALIFLGFGQHVLNFLGITLFDFKIAGGIVLLLVALADLASGPDAIQKASGSSGIVPLAVPLITGPAAITTLILEVGNRGYVIPLLAMIANYLIAWFALSQCERIEKVLGKDGTVVVSKIAALLLASIAVSMIRNGVFAAIANGIR